MSWAHAGLYSNDILPPGTPVGTTTITVKVAATGALATLYADRDRSVSLANPVQTDQLGNYAFYADPGLYTATVGSRTFSLVVPPDQADNAALAGATFTGTLTASAGIATGRTTVANTAYTVLTTDHLVVYTSITAARIVTLPSVSAASGQQFIIKDESGSCDGTKTITLTPASGTIDGAATKVINSAYGVARIYSNGTNWFTF